MTPTAWSRGAIASFVLALIPAFPVLPEVGSIAFGRRAIQDIDASNGRLRGRRLAVAGIFLSGVQLLILVAAVLALALGAL